MDTLTIAGERKIQALHAAFHTLEGDGFEVRRAIPWPGFEAIRPFVFLDHFGPIEVRPGEAKGALAHPHAGIETLSLLLEGRTLHNDSLGNVSAMGSGEVYGCAPAAVSFTMKRLMNSCIARGRMHGVQLWINMPKGSKHTDPDYTHVKAGEIPLLPHETGTARLVAGRVGNLTGPVRTSGDPFVVHASLRSGGTLRMDATKPDELAVYVMTGNVAIDGQAVEPGQLACLTSGDTLHILVKENSELLLIGGDPLDAPIVRHGPFVMNTIAEVERAVLDYHAGRMGQI
jgi:quercetin 2,3-dioxygenase